MEICFGFGLGCTKSTISESSVLRVDNVNDGSIMMVDRTSHGEH
jgi:hypothetical protein